MLLTSRFEMWLGWGPDLCFFYNDAYIPTLGNKHPSALGCPFREVWAEVYADVSDQVDLVRSGSATWNEALLLLLERSGYPEETYHSFSYSPLFGASGGVDGMLCVVNEETERVINERRMEMLQTMGSKLVGVTERDGVRNAVSAALSANRRDFPFALAYPSGDGMRKGHACTEDAETLLDHPWPLGQASDPATAITIPMPPNLTPPTGPWDRPPDHAVIIPIPGATDQPLEGHLVLGLNPYRRRDASIDDLAQLIAGQISGALANVAALDRERRRADRIWTNSRDLMIVIDAAGILQSASPAWTRVLGHPFESVVGRDIWGFVLAEDIEATQRALSQAIGEAEVTGFENRYITADGGYRWLSWNTSRERGLVYAYGRDITDQKNNEAALLAAEDALRQSQKMEAVGQLTGGIAHDFNNLLTGIMGSLEMMQRKAAQGQTADVARYAAAATTSANRAAGLTQRLLAFSRRQSLDPKSVDANQLARGMDELIRRTIGEAIELEFVVAGGLWRTRCDPNQLESAILNLAINARDAMPDGGRLTIETANSHIDAAYARQHRFASPGQYVTVSITDTGHGMSADIISKAFDPFFTTKPIGQGTGLGLSMIYGFARQSEGFVKIYSEIAQGTTVRLYLPRHHGGDTSEPVDEITSAARPISEKSKVIMVVEDEPAVMALVVDVLEGLGHVVVQAMDGPSGLEILLSNQPVDLLITDVGLPGLNGRQLADAARSKRRDLKILFVTGYAHNAAVGNGLLEPGMEIMTKPFAIDILADRVLSMLEV
jgi:PAS domain S-box-containing protein